MSEVAIAVNSLSKKFRFNDIDRVEGNGSASGSNEFYALKDVSLTIKEGEVVGLIGRNGAGKSTLLKILSGITKPTKGTVSIHGTAGSMLEVGTGFNPDLTGRENVFMNGNLLGLSRKDIAARMDAIVNFSGIGKFIDTQVKHYSSGMYVRLAFSILTKLDTDILLLDEVLSVGDADFRIKSFDALMELAKSGRTVVLASHNPQEVQALCSRVIWIEDAGIKMDGTATETIEEYLLQTHERSLQGDIVLENNTENKQSAESSVEHQTGSSRKVWTDADSAPGNERIRLLEISVTAAGKTADQPIYMEDDVDIFIEYEKRSDSRTSEITFELFTVIGVHVLTDSINLRFRQFNHTMPKGRYRLKATIPGKLLNRGTYFVTLGASENMREMVFEFKRILFFKIYQNPIFADSESNKEIFAMNEFIDCAIKPQLNWVLENDKQEKII